MDSLDPSITEALRAWRVQHSAGVDIGRALQTSAAVCSIKEGQTCFAEAARQVDSGRGIEGALNALRPILSDGERAVIAAGWNSGRIEQMMDSIVQQRELWHQARTKIRSGLVLPVVTLLVASFVAPLPAFITGNIGAFGYLFNALAPLIAGYFVWKFIERLLEQRPPFVDPLLLKLPVVSGVERSRSIGEFATQLSLLLNAGVPITHALETCSRTVTNRIYRDDVRRCTAIVKQGVPLSSALPANPRLWPPEFIASLATGEISGRMDEVLLRIGNQARDGYARAVAALAAWLPRVIYAMVAIFIIIQIALLVATIAGYYRV